MHKKPGILKILCAGRDDSLIFLSVELTLV